MKQLIYFTALILFFGCTNSQTVKKGFVIKGQVSNPDENEFTFIREKVVKNDIDTVKLDNNGKFEIRNDIKTPGYFKIKYDRKELILFMRPGDSIEMSFDAENVYKTMNFTGTGSEINNFIIKEYLMRKDMLPPGRKLYSLKEKEFIQLLDSVKNTLIFNVQNFKKDNPDVNESFIKYETASVIYTWATQRMNYERAYRYYSKNDSFEVSSSYNDYLKSLDINDDALINLKEFTDFIKRHNDQLAYAALSKEKSDDEITGIDLLKKSIDVAETTFENEKIKGFVNYSILHDHIKYSGTKDIDEILQKFNQTCPNKEFVDKINEMAGEWAHLKSGLDAPDFSGVDTSGQEIKLSDFKGKYVYIDVWATWCRPCLHEIPYLKQLEEKNRGKNIVFMSISVDNTEKPWRKMVTEEELKGIQIHAGGWDSDVAKNYLVRSIPRFILIDREGKIIDANAERPTGKIEEIINGLEGL